MKPKVIFKQEANLISKLRNALKNSQKLNGTQVILGGTNKERLDLCITNLEEAYKLITEIT